MLKTNEPKQPKQPKQPCVHACVAHWATLASTEPWDCLGACWVLPDELGGGVSRRWANPNPNLSWECFAPSWLCVSIIWVQGSTPQKLILKIDPDGESNPCSRGRQSMYIATTLQREDQKIRRSRHILIPSSCCFALPRPKWTLVSPPKRFSAPKLERLT